MLRYLSPLCLNVLAEGCTKVTDVSLWNVPRSYSLLLAAELIYSSKNVEMVEQLQWDLYL